jgi:bifunctional UDP-N-acetylglucosamine pyrophosphorylase / glucosamine-1-phosphate N-acetyltransferase
MKSTLQVAILAAGEGKRMQSGLPKVLHPLAGRPMLAHVLTAARALEPRGICVVYGSGGERVREAMAAADVVWAKQSPPRGTGDAVRRALDMLPADGVTLVMVGDVPLLRPQTLSRLVEAIHGESIAVLTAMVPDPTGLGRIVRDESGCVCAIVEHRDSTPAQLAINEINTGVIAAPTALLIRWLSRITNDNAQGEYYLTDAVALAVADGVAVVTETVDDPDEVQGVNDRAQLVALERVLQKREAARLLREGVWICDPARFDVRGTIECERDVSIDVNCVFEGVVNIAEGACVGANCVVKNATIGNDTVIAPFSHIEDAHIGNRCRIGPFARIRPASVLADDVHIGNFVEVKASTIGDRSKANHLAYVGDTTVGRDVNIGAGTITCNYDGANKHRTVIEDDVHIGSDTQIVAPLTIGRGATIGAGTTLWRDVAPGVLAVNEKTQIANASFERPRKKVRQE